MAGLLHLVQLGGDWAGPQPTHAPPHCTICNSQPTNGQCTNHRIAVAYISPLLCGFNVVIKGLKSITLNDYDDIGDFECQFAFWIRASLRKHFFII